MAAARSADTDIQLAQLATATGRTRAALTRDAVARYAARETTIVAAIARGQADTLNSRVTPSEAVARQAGVTFVAPRTKPTERAVVWTATGRDGLIESLQRLTEAAPNTSSTIASWIVGTADALGDAAQGTPGRLPFTYEKMVPGLAYILVFEIVTWTKAGEVIAILHLIDQTLDSPCETAI